jgi:hypothetical protein
VKEKMKAKRVTKEKGKGKDNSEEKEKISSRCRGSESDKLPCLAVLEAD